MENDVYCDVCGKDMTYHYPETQEHKGTVRTLIGMNIVVHRDHDHLTEFCQKQLGPYELGKQYNICYECVLKALGVPAPVTEG